MGNISTYSSPDEGSFTYTYDNQGQLTKAVNGSTTYTYSYDGAGNILSKSDGTTSHSYSYTDYDWRDLLTAYDGQTISYDGAGNPTSYYNGTRWTFTWGNGRRLETASNGSSNLSYNYTADGIRTSKTANGVTHTYYYSGNTLLRETYGNTTLDFFYDSNGTPAALKHNNNLYYYITNLQGDVIRLVDANGNTVALYKYDPFGNPIHASGSLATINPLRYRGYYYDTETGLYYCQSRYYDPVVGRFINADEYTSTGQGIIGNNMFAYCDNNPVLLKDDSGQFAVSSVIIMGAAIGGAVNYAGQFIQQLNAGKSGLSAFVYDINWGKVASSSFSGALAAAPGGFAKEIADSIGSVVIEHGVNCILGQKFDTKQFTGDMAQSIVSLATPKFIDEKLNAKVPYYIRDIKQEARDMGIKGTRRLTQYLNFKQTATIMRNSFINDAKNHISSCASSNSKARLRFTERRLAS